MANNGFSITGAAVDIVASGARSLAAANGISGAPVNAVEHALVSANLDYSLGSGIAKALGD